MASAVPLPVMLLVGVAVMLVGSGAGAAGVRGGRRQGQLRVGFYDKSCPAAERIVGDYVRQHVHRVPTVAPALLRTHYHDCFVRGCDGSILLNSTAAVAAEKDAPPNLSLAGFEVIDEVKAALERACPGVVSCADIVALAARDSVSFQYGKKLWEVETGRRDGTLSFLQQAFDEIPAPSSTFDILLANFSGKGLGLQDLVVLSGGHTIGIGNCNLFSSRVFNFTGKNNPTDIDPSLNPPYAKFLQGQCRRNLQDPNDNTTVVPMDPGSSTSFDSHYFVNLKARQGMFTSDATLLTNGRAAALVDKLQDNGVFFDHFKNSIKRMGQIDVLTGASGQVRNKCNVVNS